MQKNSRSITACLEVWQITICRSSFLSQLQKSVVISLTLKNKHSAWKTAQTHYFEYFLYIKSFSSCIITSFWFRLVENPVENSVQVGSTGLLRKALPHNTYNPSQGRRKGQDIREVRSQTLAKQSRVLKNVYNRYINPGKEPAQMLYTYTERWLFALLSLQDTKWEDCCIMSLCSQNICVSLRWRSKEKYLNSTRLTRAVVQERAQTDDSEVTLMCVCNFWREKLLETLTFY